MWCDFTYEDCSGWMDGQGAFWGWHLLVGVGKFSLRATEEVVGGFESLTSALTKWKWQGDMKDMQTQLPVPGVFQ